MSDPSHVYEKTYSATVAGHGDSSSEPHVHVRGGEFEGEFGITATSFLLHQEEEKEEGGVPFALQAAGARTVASSQVPPCR